MGLNVWNNNQWLTVKNFVILFFNELIFLIILNSEVRN